MSHSRKTRFSLPWIALVAATLFAASHLSVADTPDPYTQAKRLGHGVNIVGYDPIWTDFEKRRFQEKHFRLIKEGGFSSVRINLFSFPHMDANNQLNATWFKTLDWVVEKALVNDLAVIIDLHDYNDMGKEPEKYKSKYLAFWKQVAPHFKNAPSNVVFELLNEPNNALTDELWNTYLLEGLAVIRETNPTRTVIVGPGFYNSIDHLETLKLPASDKNLIATFHYYEPHEFTHQGAPWTKDYVNLSGITWGSEADKKNVLKDFGKAKNWAIKNKRPLFIGEFGAYDKAATADRAAYTTYIARTAEAWGWGWAYWQFDSDFILYDIDKDQWVEPIRSSLEKK